ncbi:MAG TPA: GWxTD domain-containing protein [Terriglobales bacterium]
MRALSRRTLSFKVLGFILALVALSVSGLAASKATLPEKYKKWLNQDVTYIISNDEKKAFLQLPTDTDRDNFIEHFWDVRNPTPGSPDNSYRTEHYRRIEYANQYFGHISHTEGWRTDMGRIYITLGEPQQRQKLLGLQKITPMEIWFYQNSNPALPPYFYVIFYQRDPTDEFRIYHPYSDGPERLITASVGPTRQEALHIIEQDVGNDVARETLSLIPDEPVDLSGGAIGLASDVMLATIHDLPNNPMTKEEIANRRRLLEDVSHRVILGEEFLDVITAPMRDPGGNTSLHYVLRLKKPDDFTVGQSEKQGYYYSILVSAKVKGADGKLIFSDDKKISKSISAAEFDEIKGKVFGYEGVLPLPPGKYKVEFELSNLLSNVAFHRDVEVEVPQVPQQGLQVSNIVPFVSAKTVDPRGRGVRPFTGAGVKFLPRAGGELQLTQGEPLRFFYQVWAPSLANSADKSKSIAVDYVYGRMGAQDNKTVTDQIPLNQLDPAGSVINGKQILTADLQPGNYRLVMTLRDPASGAKAYGSLNFSVSDTRSAAAAWDTEEEEASPGGPDWQRASCYLAMGNKSLATDWFHSAYSKEPGNERFRDKLIELYFAQQDYAKVVDVYSRGGLTDSTDEQTIVRLAESFSKLGNLPKAVAVMESGTALNPKSGSLLLGLADYYRRAGQASKAAAAEQKGKQLMAASPAS